MQNTRSVPTDRLLELAHSGDTSALDKLLSRSRKYLSVLARSQVHPQLQGKADSSDIVQEALLEIHRHFGQFRGSSEAEFAAWARSILAGLMANHVRRFLGTKQRDVRLEKSLVVEMSNSSTALTRELGQRTSSPSEQAERREASTLLSQALRQLPEHYRRVIVLRHLEGLPFSEVAARMERSVDSVEKLWVRALARLREKLGDEL